MAWINGLERKRFNEEQKRLAEQYHAAGQPYSERKLLPQLGAWHDPLSG